MTTTTRTTTTTINKFCFNLFIKAKMGQMDSFYRYLTKNAQLINQLKDASPQQLSMFLYGVRIFPPKNEKHWKSIIRTLSQNTENIDKGNIILLSNILSKKRAGSDDFWNKIETQAQESLPNLKMYQVVSLCSSFAKIKGHASNNPFWKSAEKTIRNSAHELELDELEEIFQAFSRIQYKNTNFWDFATNLWESRIKELTKKQAVTLLWSYSKIASFYYNPSAINKLETHITSVISKLNSHQLLTVIYSKVRLNSKDLSFLKSIEKNFLSQVHSAKFDYIIIVAYCLAKLQHHNKDFFEAFAIRLINHVNKYEKDIKTRDLANSAWTFARISQGDEKNTYNQQIWKTLEDQVLKVDDSKIDTKSLTTLLWSFGRMKKGSALLWKKFSSIVVLRVNELDINHVTIIFNTFSYKTLADQEFWSVLENKTKELLQLPDLAHYHLSKLLRSNAKITTVYKISPELKDLFIKKFHHLLAQQAELKFNDLFDYILGFSSLGVSDNETWSQLTKLYQAKEKELSNDKMRALCDQIFKSNLQKPKASKLWIKK